MPLSETEKKIIEQVKKEVRSTPKLIAKKLDLNNQHIRNLMSDLCRFGFLKRITRGVYEATSKKIPQVKTVGRKAKDLHDKYKEK
ncbi:MAG: hypothetical protein GF329_16495 [Candidatus Lokiarchaeota archaeon]|nr:hypothetical protein [Candidatus Lokiarchaeota archaeon]